MSNPSVLGLEGAAMSCPNAWGTQPDHAPTKSELTICPQPFFQY